MIKIGDKFLVKKAGADRDKIGQVLTLIHFEERVPGVFLILLEGCKGKFSYSGGTGDWVELVSSSVEDTRDYLAIVTGEIK